MAATDDGFAFDYTVLISAAQSAWPASAFVPAGPRKAAVSHGQLQVPVEGKAEVLASLLASGKGIRLEGGPAALAQFVSWMAATLHLPEDGSVVVLGWARDDVPLHPRITAEDLLRLRA